MQLIVYKGFDKRFYEGLTFEPLIEGSIENKLNIYCLNNDISDQIQINILIKKTGRYWLTYEEFYCAKDFIEQRIKNTDNLKVDVINNNIYPNFYPLYIDYEEAILNNLIDFAEQRRKPNDKEKIFLKMYSAINKVNDTYYISYYNDEIFSREVYNNVPFYTERTEINKSKAKVDYVVDISNDISKYIEHIDHIKKSNFKTIGVVKNGNNNLINLLFDTLKIFLYTQGITEIYWYNKSIVDDDKISLELKRIAKEDLKIPGFKDFRKLKFYKNPIVNNDIVEISQSTIINTILEQSKLAINNKKCKDIFLTASTGAGKSIIFQIPAIYLAKKYNRLTIIIEPIKELMTDQVRSIKERGYHKVAYINSDITIDHKEEIIKDIKDSKIHILYLSPETLLSYSIDSIIGDREIGLLIVDEAHIVTTWGVGFRPDYWYLGNYINNLRKDTNSIGIKDKKKNSRKFPICAFTATAVVGGLEDTVDETIISLYMNDTIKFIGNIRRDNIKFDINIDNDKYGKSNYDSKKVEYLSNRIDYWIKNNEKSIVYFPYHRTAMKAYDCIGEFDEFKPYKDKLGIYTGKADQTLKQNSLIDFRQNKRNTMFCTKAFGMGIDIDDIKNVYHFAVSGNLSDYIQEIGRVARKEGTIGYAITDYLKKDMNYMNNLFGMSSIKHFHIEGVLSILYDVYKSKSNRRFLVTPRMFESVFGKSKDDKELENKLKIALLMLEKDFYDTYQFKVIIARPRSMFSTAFVCVEREHLQDVKNSKYWKYFKFHSKGRNQVEMDNGVKISDMGDIYIIKLKEMWEQLYSNKSFAQFKYQFYNPEEGIMPKIQSYIFPRQKLTISLKNIQNFKELNDICEQEIDFICEKLSELKDKGEYFTINEFEEKLIERYGRTIKAKVISQSFINIIDPDRKSIKTRTYDNGEIKYLISNGIYRTLAEKALFSSNLYRKLIKIDKAEYIEFLDKNSQHIESSLKALKLLSLLDLITYEILGGDNPEIYIFISDPEKIRKIVNNQIYYKNHYVDLAIQKHTRSIKILDYFFRELKSDDERWDYIEDYFLGEDVLDKYNYIKSKNIEHKLLSASIEKKKSFKVDKTNSWNKIKDIFDESYQPIIKRLNNKKIELPDYLNALVKINSFKKVKTIMVWEDKEILIFNENIGDEIIKDCKLEGWSAYKISELNDCDLSEIF